MGPGSRVLHLLALLASLAYASAQIHAQYTHGFYSTYYTPGVYWASHLVGRSFNVWNLPAQKIASINLNGDEGLGQIAICHVNDYEEFPVMFGLVIDATLPSGQKVFRWDMQLFTTGVMPVATSETLVKYTDGNTVWPRESDLRGLRGIACDQPSTMHEDHYHVYIGHHSSLGHSSIYRMGIEQGATPTLWLDLGIDANMQALYVNQHWIYWSNGEGPHCGIYRVRNWDSVTSSNIVKIATMGLSTPFGSPLGITVVGSWIFYGRLASTVNLARVVDREGATEHEYAPVITRNLVSNTYSAVWFHGTNNIYYSVLGDNLRAIASSNNPWGETEGIAMVPPIALGNGARVNDVRGIHVMNGPSPAGSSMMGPSAVFVGVIIAVTAKLF